MLDTYMHQRREDETGLAETPIGSEIMPFDFDSNGSEWFLGIYL